MYVGEYVPSAKACTLITLESLTSFASGNLDKSGTLCKMRMRMRLARTSCTEPRSMSNFTLSRERQRTCTYSVRNFDKHFYARTVYYHST